jgi:hypothetical protein
MATEDQEEEIETGEPADLAEEISSKQVAEAPTDTGDPQSIIEAEIPVDIRERYEVYSYRNAAVILSKTRRAQFDEILTALRDFRITRQMIQKSGGNESDIPKLLSAVLRPLGWYETVIQGDLRVTLTWRGKVREKKSGKNKGDPVFGKLSREVLREKYLDGHKIDYVKDRVAFDLEWNSKDQTFDRDLYAFNAFFLSGVIDAGVLVTRSKSLDRVFKALGPALKKDGVTIERKSSGMPRGTFEKYGASTTWMGKLLYRLNAGRNGGCPVLAIGITPRCIADWTEEDEKLAATLPAEPGSEEDSEG